MALDEFIEPEVGIAIAATAIIASPQARGFLRRGAVYGMAGLMMAGDAVMSFAQAAGRGARQAADEVGQTTDEAAAAMTADDEAAAPQATAPARTRAKAATRRPATGRPATARRRASATSGEASANA